MNRPLVATYRLQFREGTDFAAASELAPYLKKLGVSHFYASPIFAASPGSTHGYDVVDYNRFEADLGGDPGFTAMSDALTREDLGLILDFVPNHMGVSPENGWWEDVLAWGRESRHATTFDIAWDAEKILVPVLGKPYGEALADGDLKVVVEPERARFRFDAGGYQLPIDPRSLGHVFGFLEHEERDRLNRRFAVATPVDGDELTERLREHLGDAGFQSALTHAVEAINGDRTALHGLHEAQNWRLAWWRTAREKLTYRRFFEIADLIGVRQEIRHVFRDSHRTVIRLAKERRLDGIRIDHVDGLADPKNYLLDLRQAFQSARRDPLIYVEKILTGEERLRTSWDIQGTTGYEFITALSGLYVDATKEEAMAEAYADFLGEVEDLRGMIKRQKRSIFARNLAGELAYLTGEALDVAARGLSTRDLGPDTIQRSIVEVAASLPVYRTYVGVDGVPTKDVAIIDAAVAEAKSGREVEADEPIEFIGRLLKLDFEEAADVAGALNFTRRFQQTTGAVMAKAVEDTVFYRYNRLIALNEVGGEPDHYGAELAAFHEAMRIRVEDQPEGLLATSTHDTKRGEDARARLYTLSEAPERWETIVAKGTETLGAFRHQIEPLLVSPDPATEWGFYQSLLGVLPADFDPKDRKTLAEIETRLLAFVEKAVREAKRYTSWTSPAEDYESALKGFVSAALDPANGFLETFWQEVQPFVAAGALNSLSQVIVKMAAPGVPDIYQGTEFYDLSLVDPDNRRPIDFSARVKAMDEAMSMPEAFRHWRDGRIKAKVTAASLKARQREPELFTRGDYLPLAVEGPLADHVIAFARLREEAAAIAVAPRMSLKLLADCGTIMPGEGCWGDTAIRLTGPLIGRDWEDVLDKGMLALDDRLRLGDLPGKLPFAFLLAS
ncbi:malto-oligosyltrehalose synthase [Aureimonas endophytica]|uniref:Malto-oligosyltrehalose synthase n=1 Tax=Aureimonas endophytica TaxID=2027858 RepID=A0A917A005_9HYPH|nr:malto-oligosyltrehalose synthase [Aureimonas endophytica]GGE20884.1 malto-oligosyltrehalose synthase [Aureimonas endophytica]